MDFVAQVKEIQRSDASGKLTWWNHCDEKGGSVRDPSKHDAKFLKNFLKLYNSGALAGGTDSGNLAELFKEGQRSAPSFKQAWADYACNSGLEKNDPTKNSKETLIGFLEHLGQQARIGQVLVGNWGGKQSGMPVWHGQTSRGEPARKKMKVSAGNAKKNELVEQIKAFQRSDEDNKQAWWAFCEEQPLKKRDPALHEIAVLKEFCSENGIC